MSSRCPGGMHDKDPRNVCCDACWARVPTRLSKESRPWRTELRNARAIRSWRQIELILTGVRDWLTDHPKATSCDHAPGEYCIEWVGVDLAPDGPDNVWACVECGRRTSGHGGSS